MASLKYWLWLTTRERMPVEGAFHLLEYFGSPEAAYFADPAEYELAGMSPAHRVALADKNLAGADRILGECDRLGLRILTVQDAEYPERLRQIPNPPCALYVKGKLYAFDEEIAIGVVGSRNPSPYGLEMAGSLGLELARCGALVVSGIAQGLDSAALKGALQGGGGVVSVLGGGIDVIYPPQNRCLYEDVAAAGALISEYPPGTPTEGWHFPVRNRIISGLSLGVVAVEAAERSGTLITARLALDQNRDVFAFPGPANAPMSMGTNRLIQRGEAKLILSARDVLSEYEDVYPSHIQRPMPPAPKAQKRRPAPAERAGQTPSEADSSSADIEEEVDKGQKRAYITLKDYREEFTDDEREILIALGDKARHPDDLVEATQIPARRVLSTLTILQVRGHVVEKPGKRFEATAIFLGEEPPEA